MGVEETGTRRVLRKQEWHLGILFRSHGTSIRDRVQASLRELNSGNNKARVPTSSYLPCRRTQEVRVAQGTMTKAGKHLGGWQAGCAGV